MAQRLRRNIDDGRCPCGRRPARQAHPRDRCIRGLGVETARSLVAAARTSSAQRAISKGAHADCVVADAASHGSFELVASTRVARERARVSDALVASGRPLDVVIATPV